MDENFEHEKDNEDCKICDTYELFTDMMADGLPMDDAFHEAVDMFAEDLFEVSVEMGVEEGYTLALRDIAGQANEVADKLDEQYGTCDCCDEDLSEEELEEIISAINESDDVEVIYRELTCGEDCGCADDECEFNDANELSEDDAEKIEAHMTDDKDDNEDEDEDDFVHGEEFVEWLKERMGH